MALLSAYAVCLASGEMQLASPEVFVAAVRRKLQSLEAGA